MDTYLQEKKPIQATILLEKSRQHNETDPYIISWDHTVNSVTL